MGLGSSKPLSAGTGAARGVAAAACAHTHDCDRLRCAPERVYLSTGFTFRLGSSAAVHAWGGTSAGLVDRVFVQQCAGRADLTSQDGRSALREGPPTARVTDAQRVIGAGEAAGMQGTGGNAGPLGAKRTRLVRAHPKHA